jgi:predicted PurR-regulated permease PerM
LATAAAWLLGLGLQLTDGQTFRNALVLLAAAFLGSLPWVPLLFRERGTRRRRAAAIIVLLSLILMLLITINLPAAYEFQQRFNEAWSGR